MKVLELIRTEQRIEDLDYKEALKITIDGKSVFSVSDGEPEDSNLSRDFGDCFDVISLMEKMYNAGKSGIEVTFETVASDDM